MRVKRFCHSRPFSGRTLMAALALAVAVGDAESGPRPAVSPALGVAVLGHPSRALEMLFAPVGAPDEMYDVYESERSIEGLAGTLRARDAEPRAGSWDVQRLGLGDAFGAEGSYNRARMALLVGGRRLRVARGSLRGDDGAVTAFTLISPYPDPALRELRSGTMTIVFHVPRTTR